MMADDVVSDSECGASDDFFLSTQIQSRLDDLEEEEEQDEAKLNRLTHLIQKFANTSTVNGPNHPKSVKVRRRTKPEVSADTKPKKKRKVMSVTDQMIRKLSGKPQKLKQVSLLSRTPSGNLETVVRTEPFVDDIEGEVSYEGVFTESEWYKLRYRVLRSGYRHATETDNEVMGETNQEKDVNLWDSANESPLLGSDDWELLYARSQKQPIIEHATDSNMDCPITHSQILPRYSSPEEVPESPYLEEVECSSDEGSLIEIPAIRVLNTLETPVIVSSQVSAESLNNVTLRSGSTSVVSGTSDDE